MPTHSTNKEGKVVYPYKWRHCQEEHSSRVNTCTHLQCDHLHQVLHCVICDNLMFSKGTFHIHMKQIHPGVREAMTEAESTPTSKKTKTN